MAGVAGGGCVEAAPGEEGCALWGAEGGAGVHLSRHGRGTVAMEWDGWN